MATKLKIKRKIKKGKDGMDIVKHTFIQGKKKMKSYITSLSGELISFKDHITGASVQYGKSTSNEVFASASGNGSFST